MKADNLKDLLLTKLSELYTAEKKTMNILPKFAEACSDPDVKKAFKQHIEQSKDQVARLEQIFSKLQLKPQEIKDALINGLVEKSEEILDLKGNPDVIDAALIAAEQNIEHYEIANYGTARSYAKALKMSDVELLLQKTLKEEGYIDVKLSKIADKGYEGPPINQKAA